MMRFAVFVLFCISLLSANSLDALLQEYATTSQKSLQTVDERLGHVRVYSQKELRLMQYTTLSDFLKEIPMNNFNKNKFGISNLSLSSTKTDASGFFRFFINGHEVSSIYAQSPTYSWVNLPLDFIDYIEVYMGNSSFALGSDAGIYFIRIYTKDPSKENGSQIAATLTSRGSHSQSAMHADSLANGWSYLAYINHTKERDRQTYKNNKLYNDAQRRYFYLQVQNQNTNINFGYTDLTKDNFLGYSLDVNPDSGEIETQDYFFDLQHYFLDDGSLKLHLGYDYNRLEYEESNVAGIEVLQTLPLGIVPSYHSKDLELKKYSALLSKTFATQNNNLLIGTSYQNKQYTTKHNIVDSTEIGKFTPFDEENISSIFMQNDYRFADDLTLIANAKADRYDRSGLDNFSTEHYRVGAIYTPFEKFGLKTFYTKTQLPPSFYNIDYSNVWIPDRLDLKNQKYEFYIIEGVYASENSRLSVLYNDVRIENFIYYFPPAGFVNIDHTVRSRNWIVDYSYNLTPNHTMHLNYYTTKLSEEINNSNRGGYIKFIGEVERFDYFTCLIYKNAYRYTTASAKESYNLNLGLTYNVTKDFSLSLKGENLLNKSSQSLHTEGLGYIPFALEDSQRKATIGAKWVF